MGTGEIDSTVSDMGLAGPPQRLVDALENAAEQWSDLGYMGIHSVGPQPGDIDAAVIGTFRHHEERFRLSPPVDWWEEPYTGANERGFFQNSFTFAEILLRDPRFPKVLTPLATIFVDWLISNPRSGSAHPHRYAWHDHAAAGRIVPMAFVLREGIRRGVLDRGTCETLAAGVYEHARYLLADENYAGHNNHGIASDAALLLAAHCLAPAPETAEWEQYATRRLAAVLAYTIDREEALHLEHSPSYHWNIHGALRRFAGREEFKDLSLAGLTRRMETSGAWLVAPDGTLPPLGDTVIGKRPPSAATRDRDRRSAMRVFGRTGYAIVREGDSALFLTAAHHPTAHKHADDGSFCLYEGGRAIVLDSGCPGYEYDSPEFAYGTSPAAHATICVDGFDWAKNAPAYGSGIVAAVERGGLYALLTRNPNAVPGGGAAERLLVYAPARFLLVIDEVEASEGHQLTRHLPLAPGLEAQLGDKPGDVELREGDSLRARLVQVPTRGTAPDDVRVVRGRQRPVLGGFRFLSPEEPIPSCDVTLAGEAGAPRAFALLFDLDHARGPVQMIRTEVAGEIQFEVRGLTESNLRLRAGEDSLTVNG